MWLCYESYAFEYSVTQIEKQRKYNECITKQILCIILWIITFVYNVPILAYEKFRILLVFC